MESSSYEFIQDLGYNWAQGPIKDIKVSASCPSGSTNIIKDSWHGTVAGCNCYGTITRGTCNRSKNS